MMADSLEIILINVCYVNQRYALLCKEYIPSKPLPPSTGLCGLFPQDAVGKSIKSDGDQINCYWVCVAVVNKTINQELWVQAKGHSSLKLAFSVICHVTQDSEGQDYKAQPHRFNRIHNCMYYPACTAQFRQTTNRYPYSAH